MLSQFASRIFGYVEVRNPGAITFHLSQYAKMRRVSTQICIPCPVLLRFTLPNRIDSHRLASTRIDPWSQRQRMPVSSSILIETDFPSTTVTLPGVTWLTPICPRTMGTWST